MCTVVYKCNFGAILNFDFICDITTFSGSNLTDSPKHRICFKLKLELKCNIKRGIINLLCGHLPAYTVPKGFYKRQRQSTSMIHLS